MTRLPLELTLLGWSVVLLLVHIALQAQTMTNDRGLSWGASARDGQPTPLGPVAARAARALRNFAESYPGFIALALALVASGRTGGVGAIGAGIWFVARLIYIPLYLFGVPYLRSLAWLASILGLLLMLLRLIHPG